MNKLSSSREEIKREEIVEEIQLKEEINMKPIIEQCNTFLLSIEETYNKRTLKELHDAIIHVTSAKKCLEYINLN